MIAGIASRTSSTAAPMAAVMAAAGAIITLMICEKPADQRAAAEKKEGFGRAGPPARDDHAFFAGDFLEGAFFAVLAAGLATDFLVPALGPLLAFSGASVSLRKQRNQS